MPRAPRTPKRSASPARSRSVTTRRAPKRTDLFSRWSRGELFAGAIAVVAALVIAAMGMNGNLLKSELTAGGDPTPPSSLAITLPALCNGNTCPANTPLSIGVDWDASPNEDECTNKPGAAGAYGTWIYGNGAIVQGTNTRVDPPDHGYTHDVVLRSGTYHANVYYYCWNYDGAGETKNSPIITSSFSFHVVAEQETGTISAFDCASTNDSTSPIVVNEGEPVSCAIRTTGAVAGSVVRVGKTGNDGGNGDCWLGTVATDVGDQETWVSFNASGCIGANVNYHEIEAELLLNSALQATSEAKIDLLVNAPSNTCASLGLDPCLASQNNLSMCDGQTPARCELRAPGQYCYVPQTACTGAEYCYEGMNPNGDSISGTCKPLEFSYSIGSPTLTSNDGGFSVPVSVSNWTDPLGGNPNNYDRCILLDVYKNGFEDPANRLFSEIVAATGNGVTFSGNNGSLVGAATAHYWILGLWAPQGTCTQANLASIRGGQHSHLVGGGWEKRAVTNSGPSPSVELDCSGVQGNTADATFNDFDGVGATILNDPNRTIGIIRGYIPDRNGFFVAQGIRDAANSATPNNVRLHLNFTQGGMPMATADQNIHTMRIETLSPDGTTVIDDIAGGCTLNVQNRVSYDLSIANSTPIGSGVCTDDPTQPTIIQHNARTFTVNATLDTGNAYATSLVAGIKPHLADISNTYIGEAGGVTAAPANATGMSVDFTNVNVSIPSGLDPLTTYGLKFDALGDNLGIDGVGTPPKTDEGIKQRTCYIRVARDPGTLVNPNAPSSVTAAEGACTAGGARNGTVTVRVFAQNGSPMANAPVLLEEANGSSSIGGLPQTKPTNASGTVTFDVMGTPGQTNTFKATVNGVTLAQQPSITFTSCSSGCQSPAVISSFTANPSTIIDGQQSTLSWTVAGASALSIDRGIGTVTGLTSRTVSPNTQTTYTLTATSTDTACTTPVTRTVTVNVDPAPPQCSQPAPNGTITSANSVLGSSTSNTASVPDAGAGATYAWTISGGTITSGQGTRSITYSAGASGNVVIGVSVAKAGCNTATGSKTVSITTEPPCTPANIASLVNQTINSGQTATVNVVVAGTGPFTYQWSTGGQPIAGATNATYTTPVLTQTTQYSVTVRNACNTTGATLTMTVTVNPPQCVAPAPNGTITAAASVNAGSTGNVASVPDAGASAAYTWTITGGTITAGAGTRSITYTAGASGNVVIGVSVAKAGCNTATGTRPVGIIIVDCFPPVLTMQPIDVTLDSGQQANLAVTATGTGPLSYQWFIVTTNANGGPLHTPIAGATNPSYLTPALTATTRYAVHVSNACGGEPAESRVAVVTVIPPSSSSPICTPASITTSPQSVTATVGQSVTLTAAAAGTAPLSYQWYTQTADSRVAIPGATGASYAPPTNVAGVRNYAIVVTNACNTTGASAVVAVTVSPGPSIALAANPTSVRADGTPSTLTATLANMPANSVVTFTKTAGQGTLSSATATANTNGIATVTVSSLVVGNGTFTASANGLTSAPVTVTFTGATCAAPLVMNLTVPLEGRDTVATTPRGNHATTSLRVTARAAGMTSNLVKNDIVTDANGNATVSFDGVNLPDNTLVTVGMKDGFHLERVILVRATCNVVQVNLTNPATFTELSGESSTLKGKYFLPAGDISGGAPNPLHDNNVGPLDIAAWISSFTRGIATADLDANGSVGAEDLSLIIRNMTGKSGDTVPSVIPTGVTTSEDADFPRIACGYTLPSPGCTLEKGPDYDPASNCGLVVTCPASPVPTP